MWRTMTERFGNMTHNLLAELNLEQRAGSEIGEPELVLTRIPQILYNLVRSLDQL